MATGSEGFNGGTSGGGAICVERLYFTLIGFELCVAHFIVLRQHFLCLGLVKTTDNSRIYCRRVKRHCIDYNNLAQGIIHFSCNMERKKATKGMANENDVFKFSYFDVIHQG